MKKEKRNLLRRWKQCPAAILGAVMLITQLQLPVYAEEPESVVVTQNFGLCEHHPEHNADCGYIEPVEGQDCAFVCEECSKEEPQEKENDTVSGNTLNNSIPGTISGNDIISVTSDEVKEVQDLIDALPSLDEVKAMNKEEQNAAYTQVQTAYETYEALSEEEQSQITGTEKFEKLFGYFNGMVALAAAVPLSETCPFTITGDNVADTDYTWDNTTKKLTINTTEELTISMAEDHDSAAATIVAGENESNQQIDLDLTLAGVNITAPSYSAISTGGALSITLADDTTNTLTGGTGSSYGIYAAGALSISGNGTLKATGGQVSGSGYSAGIFSSTSIIIDGGVVTATGGSSSGSSYGIYAYNGNSNINPTITIDGGTVTATGGNATTTSCGMSASGSITIENGTVTATGGTGANSYGLRATSSSISITSGNVTATGNNAGIQGSFSTGTDGKAIIHASSISDNDDKSGWKGIIFEGRTDATGYDGVVYGNQTLEKDFTVNGGEDLTIPEGTKLTLNNNMTLTNSGAIHNNGIIDVTYGNLAGEQVGGSGKIIKNGAMVFGPFLVTGGTGTTAPCEWTELEKTLTINTSEALTISMAEGVTTPVAACITAKNTSGSEGFFTYGTINLTLDGVHITAQGPEGLGSNGYNTAVLRGGKIDLTLKGSNTLTGGDATNKSSRGIYATHALTINGDGSLTATGGAVTGTDTSKDSAGIYSETSITITSGKITAIGNSSSGGSYGIYASNGSSNATITISGGNVTATGGSAATTSCGMSANDAIMITDGSVEATGGTATNNSYGIRSVSENISITGGTGTAKTDETNVTNKGAMNKAPTFGTGLAHSGTSSDTELKWFPAVTSVTVTYDGNGATGGTVPVDSNSPYSNGTSVTVLGNTGNLVKDGFTFDGWNTAANGTGTAYAAGATFTISSNTILYAQWKANDGNTGGGDTDNGGTGGNGGGNQGGSNQDNDKPTKPVQPDKPEKPVVPPVIPPNPMNPVLPEVEPVNPFHPFKPLPPTKPDTPADEEEPFIKGDDGNGNTDTGSGWNVITDQTEAAKDGDKITVDMNGATTVPGNVIESIAGKDVTVVFDMGEGILWTVNGLSVTAENIQDINLNVSKNTANIPVDVINNVTGERYSMTISLEYDGEFGFTAVLTVNMEKKNAGLYANLFYYNPDAEVEDTSDAADTDAKGALEFICADEIDADGNADLEFTHASDYTIVIDKAPMDGSAEETDAQEQTEEKTTQSTEPEAINADDESDSNGTLIWILMIAAVVLLAGVGGYVYYTNKKKEDEQ